MESSSSSAAWALNKAELKVAFKAWAEQHGYIWFGGDLALAQALVSYLGMDGYKIDGVAVTGDGEGMSAPTQPDRDQPAAQGRR
jgi:hypothetical protein